MSGKFFALSLILVVLALAPMALAQEAGENTVNVSLVEFEIQMPNMIPAGPITFEVSNDGTMEHNFEIEGQGIEEEFETNLQPGETRTMQVDLQPGEYAVYCPVSDHRQQGMTLTLIVTEAETVQPTSEAAVEAAATPATPQETQPQALPSTGGVIPSWSGVLLLTVGVLLLVIGGLSFTLTHRRKS
jgi:uncharacterized cupredoxin-like copper-binding protein